MQNAAVAMVIPSGKMFLQNCIRTLFKGVTGTSADPALLVSTLEEQGHFHTATVLVETKLFRLN